MLTPAIDTCARPQWADFDQIRTGYAGQNSAFSDRRRGGFWLVGGAYALAFGATLYAILRHGDHRHRNVPTSP